MFLFPMESHFIYSARWISKGKVNDTYHIYILTISYSSSSSSSSSIRSIRNYTLIYIFYYTKVYI